MTKDEYLGINEYFDKKERMKGRTRGDKRIKVETFGDYVFYPVKMFEEITEWIRKHPNIHILNALLFRDEGTYMNIYYEEES